MGATKDMFGPRIPVPGEHVRPIQPLYSMLMDMPDAALNYTFEQLNEFSDDKELDEFMPEIGLKRRTYLEQVLLALQDRQGR